MEKGEFGKIRKAVLEIAHESARAQSLDTPQKRHVRNAFIDFRDYIDREHKEQVGNLVSALAAEHDIRKAMTPKEFDVFAQVTDEHWQRITNEIIDAYPTAVEGIVKSEGEVDLNEFAQKVFLGMLEQVDTLVFSDPRLKHILLGKEEKMLALIHAYNLRLRAVFKEMLEEEEEK